MRVISNDDVQEEKKRDAEVQNRPQPSFMTSELFMLVSLVFAFHVIPFHTRTLRDTLTFLSQSAAKTNTRVFGTASLSPGFPRSTVPTAESRERGREGRHW